MNDACNNQLIGDDVILVILDFKSLHEGIISELSLALAVQCVHHPSNYWQACTQNSTSYFFSQSIFHKKQNFSLQCSMVM